MFGTFCKEEVYFRKSMSKKNFLHSNLVYLDKNNWWTTEDRNPWATNKFVS